MRKFVKSFSVYLSGSEVHRMRLDVQVVNAIFQLPNSTFCCMQILHKFRKKVYPESSTVPQKLGKPHKNEIKNTNEARPSSADCMLPDEDIIIFPQQSLSNMSKESMRCFRSHSNPPQIAISGSDSNGNRECWIKTDANCKYACFNSPHSSIAIDSVVNKIQQSPFPNCY